MNYTVRFYISWIIAAIVMYSAFYMWHGIFLNDLNRVTVSKPLFLFLAALVYLVISFVLYRTFESKTLSSKIHSPLLKGLISGICIGFMMFAVVFVLGVSFTKTMSLTYLIADFSWQIIEQILGGILIGFGKMFIFEPHPDMIRND